LQQLIDRTGFSRGGVSDMLKELHSTGKCRIQRWRKSACKPIAVYAAGPGQDSKTKPVPMTSAERDARYIKKLERTGRLGERQARMASNRRALIARKNGDPLVAALFGMGRAQQAKEGV